MSGFRLNADWRTHHLKNWIFFFLTTSSLPAKCLEKFRTKVGVHLNAMVRVPQREDALVTLRQMACASAVAGLTPRQENGSLVVASVVQGQQLAPQLSLQMTPYSVVRSEVQKTQPELED